MIVLIPLNIYVIVFRAYIIQVVKLFHVHIRVFIFSCIRVLIIARVYASLLLRVYTRLHLLVYTRPYYCACIGVQKSRIHAFKMISLLFNIIFFSLLDSDWLKTVPINLNRHIVPIKN